MRFVAGQGAVLRCCVQGSVAEILLAGALWLSCCWPGRRGGEPSGISCLPGRRGEAPSGRACRSTEDDAAASGSQQAHTKREGPGRDLNISPEPLLFIVLRKGNTPCDEAEPPFTAGMQCRRSCRRHSSLAFTAGIQCWRSCRCNYAGIARKVAANARIA